MNRRSQKSSSYRMVVLGSPMVGKTSLISMFLQGAVSPCYTPTVEHCNAWKLSQGDWKCHLNIIDTCGSNDFPAMHKLYITTGNFFVLVHSVDDPQSFEKVLQLLEEINNERFGEEVLIFVVGNKADRRRHGGMSIAEAELLLIDYMDVVRYSECISLNKYSVDSVFAQIADEVLGALGRSESSAKEIISNQDDKKGWFRKTLKRLRLL